MSLRRGGAEFLRRDVHGRRRVHAKDAPAATVMTPTTATILSRIIISAVRFNRKPRCGELGSTAFSDGFLRFDSVQ